MGHAGSDQQHAGVCVDRPVYREGVTLALSGHPGWKQAPYQAPPLGEDGVRRLAGGASSQGSRHKEPIGLDGTFAWASGRWVAAETSSSGRYRGPMPQCRSLAQAPYPVTPR
jgi:hypothetical protein